jgi:signal transduction histidine kinase/PAS domain-containing protein
VRIPVHDCYRTDPLTDGLFDVCDSRYIGPHPLGLILFSQKMRVPPPADAEQREFMRAEETQPESTLAGERSTRGNGAERARDNRGARMGVPPMPAIGTGPVRTPSVSTAIRKVPSLVRRSTLIRYGAAVLFVLIALLVTMAARPYISQVVFIFFWPAVIGAAMFGGVGPGLLSSFLSVALADYFIMGPARTFQLTEPAEVAQLLVFLTISGAVSSAAGRLQAARQVATDAAKQNATLATEMENQAMELEQQLEESQALQEELEQSSEALVQQTAEAEEAEQFSRGILESISDPFVVLDALWGIRFINAPAERGFTSAGRGEAKDLIGKNLWEVFPNILGTAFEREMRRCAEERKPVTFEAFYAERGEWALMFCYPLPDGGIAAQWKDISAIKRAEESARHLARASETLSASLDYETTLKELAHVIVPEFADWCAVDIVEDDGKVRQLAVAHSDPDKVRWAYELNKRYPPDPTAPTGVHNVLRTGAPELYPEISDEMLEAGARDEDHLRISRELGLKSAIVVPLIAHGRTLGAITLVTAESGRRYGEADLEFAMELARRAALAVDNARLHRAESDARRAAEAANLAKTQFLAVMSHELRTPLNAIAGYAELMRMGIRGPVTPEQQADLDRIKRSQRNLLSLINDVLNYAKLEAGHIDFDARDVGVHEFLADIEALITPQLQGKGLSYEYDVCDSGLAVKADAEKMRQILLNLLSNAIKFTPAGGKVFIECEADDAKVRIKVRDTGVGIPADKLSAIFEPFIQLDRKLTSAHEGTGLGLAISRDLARAMSGELTAESSPGEGSAFTLELPRGDGNAAIAPSGKQD